MLLRRAAVQLCTRDPKTSPKFVQTCRTMENAFSVLMSASQLGLLHTTHLFVRMTWRHLQRHCCEEYGTGRVRNARLMTNLPS
jgi:hypothetical protein